MELSDIDLIDSRNFVSGVPHAWFAELRRQAPVYWHEEPEGPGFWAVTKYDDCVAVNRDYEHSPRPSGPRCCGRCPTSSSSSSG